MQLWDKGERISQQMQMGTRSAPNGFVLLSWCVCVCVWWCLVEWVNKWVLCGETLPRRFFAHSLHRPGSLIWPPQIFHHQPHHRIHAARRTLTHSLHLSIIHSFIYCITQYTQHNRFAASRTSYTSFVMLKEISSLVVSITWTIGGVCNEISEAAVALARANDKIKITTTIARYTTLQKSALHIDAVQREMNS